MFLQKSLKIAALTLWAMSQTTPAAAKETARVTVKNETGQTVYSVSVVHKYSSNYKESGVWHELAPNATGGFLTVRYNTGFFTTGKDWWLVSWSTRENDETIRFYKTSPNNFREVFDFWDEEAEVILPVAFGIAGAAVCNGFCGGIGTAAVAGLASTAGYFFAKGAFNSASTVGFKQHILRDDDAGRTTTITLKRNGVVRFSSPSGASETGYTSSTIRLPKARIMIGNSGQCMDVTGVSKSNSAKLQQYSCGGSQSLNQLFLVRPAGKGVQLVARHSGKCLDVAGISRQPGAPIQQWDCIGPNHENQIFEIEKDGDYVNLRAVHSGYCIAVNGQWGQNGAGLVQSSCNGSWQTRFRMDPVH